MEDVPLTYEGYWIKKVQELQKELKLLRERVDALEGRGGSEEPAGSEPTSDQPLLEKELTACMALKELGGEASVTEINEQLKKTRFIEESAKDTLLVRLKGPVEKGYMAYDSAAHKFKLIKTNFVVG